MTVKLPFVAPIGPVSRGTDRLWVGRRVSGYCPPYWREQRVSQGLEVREARLWWGWRWGLENSESTMYLIQYIISGPIGGHSLRHEFNIWRISCFWLFCFENSSVSSGTLREFSNDSFRAETNSRDICRDRSAPVSFAQFGGTAVSRRQPNSWWESETQNERRSTNGSAGASRQG